MNKKFLINALLALAIGLGIAEIINQIMGGEFGPYFWISLLVYSVAEIIKSQDKKKDGHESDQA